MRKNKIEINGRIMINVDLSVEKFLYLKKIMFGILVNVFVKMENTQHVLWMIQLLFEVKLYSHIMKK